MRCETKYTLANKVLYTITWKEGRAEWVVSSERSASGAVNAFLKVFLIMEIKITLTHKLILFTLYRKLIGKNLDSLEHVFLVLTLKYYIK